MPPPIPASSPVATEAAQRIEDILRRRLARKGGTRTRRQSNGHPIVPKRQAATPVGHVEPLHEHLGARHHHVLVDTVGDSWKRTFWTTVLPIFNFVVTVAMWKDIKGQLVNEKSTIGFDTVSTITRWDYIPNGYHGLEWENMFVMHRSWYPGSGLQHGVVSGNHGAYNGKRGPITITSTTPFSVAGFHATAVWKKGMNVLVEGFDDSGNCIAWYQTTLGDPRGGPTFIDLHREGNFKGLRKLEVTPSGGTDAGLDYDIPGLGLADIPGLGLAIDDLTVY